jgi:deoxyribodipyrimidine photo-lyase
MDFIPTRSVALAQLERFLPYAARYADQRNFDPGHEDHHGVSWLSPYIRTRLLTEEEITRAVLSRYGVRAADKFLQEIAWRTYWKGWLEMRPEVWSDYQASLKTIEKPESYDTAIKGKTGIACFDHWVDELLQNGYLHNHSRMWFASIWIFTLKLPWQLGADFFLTHLLDADPAANTLSWRWVAGLHTPGKHYIARASNIEKYTHGRFNPVGQLDENPEPVPLDRLYERQALQLPPAPMPVGRVGHLMFPEDLAEAPAEIRNIHARAAYLPTDHETSGRVRTFLNGAIADVLTERNGTLIDGDFEASLNRWISVEKLDAIVISLPTVGFTKDFLTSQTLPVSAHRFIRDWDRSLWPHATAGFFKLKSILPKIHTSLAPVRKDDLFPDV